MSEAVVIENSVAAHARALLRLAVPLAIVSLSEVAMGLTDTALLGGIGKRAVAAGGLSATLFFTVGASLQSLLAAASILVAQARGAGSTDSVRILYGTGLLLGVLMSLPAFALFSFAEPLLLRAGEPAALARDVGGYLAILRWATPAFVAALGILRAVLPAIEQPGLLLRVSPAMLVGNGLLNYGLIHGAAGLPRLGLNGSALATAATLWISAGLLLLLLHGSRTRGALVARPGFGRRSLSPMLRIGLPIAAATAAETLVFLLASLAAGRLGSAALAAHQIVLSIGTFTFMIPMALGQAANVRTGLATGAGDPRAVRRAGLVAIGMAMLAMAAIGVTLLLVSRVVVAGFLDPHDPASRDAFNIALGLIGILALFQVADGVQVVAIGALRGMGDTRVPMVFAQVGYWLLGAPLGWLLGFRLGWGAPGIWFGLAAALAAVAAMMTARFLRISRVARSG